MSLSEILFYVSITNFIKAFPHPDGLWTNICNGLSLNTWVTWRRNSVCHLCNCNFNVKNDNFHYETLNKLNYGNKNTNVNWRLGCFVRESLVSILERLKHALLFSVYNFSLSIASQRHNQFRDAFTSSLSKFRVYVKRFHFNNDIIRRTDILKSQYE